MRKFLTIAAVLILVFSVTKNGASEENSKMFSSDSVGVKLEYPAGWEVVEFKWGFAVTDDATQSTVTVKSQFFPKENETAYDINLNEEFAKVYVGKFEEVTSEERELDGLKWDYSMVIGAKGTALEYDQEMYSTLISNSLYSIELYYMTSVEQNVKDSLQKIKDSVKLMYKETELPMVRAYMKEYKNAAAKNKGLRFTALDNKVSIEYFSPWAFSGGGSGSEGGFHYFTGDPYADIDMILIKHESPDPREAVISLKTWVGLLTDTFTMVEENTATYGENKYYYQKLVQGVDEHLVYTWIYAINQGESTAVIVFAFHQRAMEKAPKAIEDFMNHIVFRT